MPTLDECARSAFDRQSQVTKETKVPKKMSINDENISITKFLNWILKYRKNRYFFSDGILKRPNQIQLNIHWFSILLTFVSNAFRSVQHQQIRLMYALEFNWTVRFPGRKTTFDFQTSWTAWLAGIRTTFSAIKFIQKLKCRFWSLHLCVSLVSTENRPWKRFNGW